MILDRMPDDEPLIPEERTKIRLEMVRKKELARCNNTISDHFKSRQRVGTCLVDASEATGAPRRDWEDHRDERNSAQYSVNAQHQPGDKYKSSGKDQFITKSLDCEVFKSGPAPATRDNEDDRVWNEIGESWKEDGVREAQISTLEPRYKGHEVMLNLSEGDATRTIKHTSAPHKTDNQYTERSLSKLYLKDQSRSTITSDQGNFEETPAALKKVDVEMNVRDHGVQKLITKSGKNEEKSNSKCKNASTSLDITMLRLGPTTLSSPRHPATCAESNSLIPLEPNSPVSTTRFSPRQMRRFANFPAKGLGALAARPR